MTDSSHVSRRSFLAVASTLIPAAAAADIVRADFPSHEPELVQEMVVVSHNNVGRVKELVGRQPALAKVSFDWGFGDWETPIDAASHMGNREIAEFLIANGARPTIFSAAMLGQLDVVKAAIAASPGVQRVKGPHSFTLLWHAVAGGPKAQAVVDYLKTIEGSDDRPVEKPLNSDDAKKLIGVYTYGVTPGMRVEIAGDDRNRLSFGRPGRYPRGITHLGDFTFVPIGAEHVRVRFTEAAGTVTLTVHDPDVVLTAKRSA
ncbi:MAG TPA: hypothetical protein VF456_26585 [Vicinamibacterales bacterium]